MKTFVDNGVEDIETISELQEEHLQMMGIPLGHKLKIMKKISTTRPVEEESKQEAKPKMAEMSTQDERGPANSLLDGEFDEAANQREF